MKNHPRPVPGNFPDKSNGMNAGAEGMSHGCGGRWNAPPLRPASQSVQRLTAPGHGLGEFSGGRINPLDTLGRTA